MPASHQKWAGGAEGLGTALAARAAMSAATMVLARAGASKFTKLSAPASLTTVLEISGRVPGRCVFACCTQIL